MLKPRFHYPRSFLKFTLLGFLVAGIPALAGLVFSFVALDRLAKDSERVVLQSAQGVKAGQDQLEAITAMERGARQYAILGDTPLRDAYEKAHARFLEAAVILAEMPWNAEERQRLASLTEGMAVLHEHLTQAGFSDRAVSRETREFARLVGLAKQISGYSHQLVDREIATLRDRVEKTRQRASALLWGLLPLVLLLAVGIPLLIVRPVRAIDAAIRRLRDGDLEQPIRVRGPSDIQYLAERLDWMRQGLYEAETDKRRVIRHLSHELKTPLTALRESADLFWDGSLGDLTPAQAEVVEIQRNNTLRLQKLIEDLLAYRALMADSMRLDPSEVVLAETLATVLKDHRVELLARALEIIDECGAARAWADPEQTRVILDNLLSNAIKYSPGGGKIRVRAEEMGEWTRLSVSDEGPGVPKEDRERLFDAFFRGQPPGHASLRGTGLGLSIARELTLAMGGRIAVESIPGSGARFVLELPRTRH